jgi:hypothetical protein
VADGTGDPGGPDRLTTSAPPDGLGLDAEGRQATTGAETSAGELGAANASRRLDQRALIGHKLIYQRWSGGARSHTVADRRQLGQQSLDRPRIDHGTDARPT